MTSKPDNFNILAIMYNVFNNDIYEWMKIEYEDVCSDGDVKINKLLDIIYLNKLNKEHEGLLPQTLSIPDDMLRYISYIYDSYNEHYLMGDSPSSFRYD